MVAFVSGKFSHRTLLKISVEDDHWVIPAGAASQPMIFDADGSLRPSLLGFRVPSASGEAALVAWINQGTRLILSVGDFQAGIGSG